MVASGHAPGGAVVGVTVAFTIVAIVATIGRLFTRVVIVRKAGLDDVCITVATVLSIMLTITMCEQVNYGLGRHFYSLSPDEKTHNLIWLWTSIWVYYLALSAVKLSILLQYLRVFPLQSFRYACFAMIGVVVLFLCWTVFSAIFACTPVAAFWDVNLQGHCLNRLAVWFSNAAINIFTDVATAVLPLPVLNRLNLAKRQRYALMAVFGLGGLTCIISILRLESLYAISKATDVTWENPLAAVWSNLEVNTGIICSCLPTLKGCITQFFPRMFGDLRSSSYVVEIPDAAPFPSKRGTALSKSMRDTTNSMLGSKTRHSNNEIRVITVLEQDVEQHDRYPESDRYPERYHELSPIESESMQGLVRPMRAYRGI